MLHRVLLIVLLLSTFLQPVASAPDVGEAMNQAKQQADDMQRYTADVLKQADDLSTSREFLEDINNEANKTLLQAETVPKQTLPNSPSVTEQQLQQARDDINRLLSQVQEQNPSTANKTNQRSGPKLYIFVSFSMPDKTLKRLLIQAARINATLILRGLADDSLGKTKDKIAQLLEADASGQTKLNGSFAIRTGDGRRAIFQNSVNKLLHHSGVGFQPNGVGRIQRG